MILLLSCTILCCVVIYCKVVRTLSDPNGLNNIRATMSIQLKPCKGEVRSSVPLACRPERRHFKSLDKKFKAK